jgi:hypothetical protein
MDKGRAGLLEEDDEAAVERGAEAEEEASLLPLGEPPFSSFRPTMAVQSGPSPPGCGTQADRTGVSICVGEGGNVLVCGVYSGWREAIEEA